MGRINKVFLFDVSALMPDDIEKFKERIDMGAFLSDVKINSKTLRISHIRAFFNIDVDIDSLVKGFNVKYTDITGTDLLNLNL